MAMFGGWSAKSDVARVATDGERSLHWPAWSPSLTKKKVIEGACAGCSKEATHNVCKLLGFDVPHGEGRGDRLPAANKLRVADVNRIQSGLAVLAHAGHGQVESNVVFATSAGQNASQSWTYEITAVPGAKRLTLKGPNPGRLVSGDVVCSMPVGAEVVYASPSALSGKNRPMITKIHPPASEDSDDVTFDVEVSIGCGSAREPIDLANPPVDGKYYCDVRFELLMGAHWLHVVAAKETAFTRRVGVEFTTDAVHELLDTDGNSTRVLWPGMLEGAITAQLFNGATAGPMVDVLEVYDGAPRLVTVDTGARAWETTLDLRGLGIGTTYTKAVVTFHPEATASDTWRLAFAGSCAHSYVEASGSYAHDGDHRCAVVDSTGFATYRGEWCWKPGSCDGFALGDKVGYFGAADFLPDDGANVAWWSGIWHRADWLLRQKVAWVSTPLGTAYVLERKPGGGPSVFSLLGGFVQSVPSLTGVATVEPWAGPVWGQRVTWTDGDGHEHQRIVPGAFVAQGMDLSADGGPDLRSDASTDPEMGGLPTEVAGWLTKTDGLGGALPDGLAALPYRLTGGMQPYAYQHNGGAFGRASSRWTSADMAITSIDLTEPGDASLAAWVRGRFG